MLLDTLPSHPGASSGRPRPLAPLWTLVALGALGGGAAGVLSGCSGPAPAPAKASISVADQDLTDPRLVHVAAARALAPGWVVVWTDAGGGAPGEPLGEVFVAAGDHVDLTVSLDRPATDLEPLVAALHVDEGALGVFEPGVDPVASSPDGTLVTASFVVHVGERVIPALAVEDQRADPPTAVVVGPVVSDGPGFLVIRADEDGAPGAILGHLAVPNRLSGPHSVPLDRPARDGETLWAMLHRDSGVPGVFEVPSGDPVFVDEEGAPVGASFRVEIPLEPAIVAFNGLAPYPPTNLSLKRVVMDEPGWLVVRADEDGEPGEVLGSAPVPHGDHRPFGLALSRPLTNVEYVHATLHRDAGAPGTLELPAPDEPLVGADGQPLTTRFFVNVPTPGLTVADQIADPADAVVVAAVSSLGPGWVLIRADDGGAPGEVLGSAAVKHYKTSGVEVTLTRPTVDGEHLWATLHQDAEPRGELHASDGAGGASDGEDIPQVGADGAPVRASFVVSAPPDAAVAVADQVLAPADEVSVDSATTYGPGWVAVQEDDGGAPGAVLGATALPGGLAEGVTVALDRPAVDGETLWAVIYLDRGDPASLDPGDPDEVAVDADGATVAAPFVVTVPAVAIVAADQVADPRDEVVLAQVVAQGPVVAAVAADAADASGTPGELLGSVALPAGVHDDVTVSLSREVTYGEPLHAVLYADADPVGTFEPGGGDEVLTDAGGAPVASTFAARWAPAVSVEDQTLGQGGAPATAVAVAQVVSEGAGWVAVAEEDGGAPGSPGTILGQVAAPAGLSTALSVPLSRPAVDGEILYAILYEDLGAAGSFEPQGPDAPVLWPPGEGGSPVQGAFTVTVLPPPPSVTPGGGAVGELSTVLTVASVFAPDGGWVAVAEDAGGGSAGALLGHAAVSAGTATDVTVEVDRPLVDGEGLVALIYGDGGSPGSFEPGGADVALSVPAPFSAVVPAGTPAVRITLDDASGAFAVSSVEPGTLAQAVGSEATNPTLQLQAGWRYEVVVATAPLGTHPLELVTRGATPAEDVVLLGAGADPGTLAAEAGIGADTSTVGALRFTVSPALEAAVDGYRCGVDVDGARGAVTVTAQ